MLIFETDFIKRNLIGLYLVPDAIKNMQIPFKEVWYYYQNADTIYKVHSPFLYELINYIKDKSRKDSIFDRIEKKRMELLKDYSVILRKDYGAGSRNSKTNERRIKDIAGTDLSSAIQCRELFRLTEFCAPKNILEFGTSLGISTAYLAAARRDAKFDTVEADPNLVNIAKAIVEELNLNQINFHNMTFSDFLAFADGPYDLVFLDGHHTYKHTIEYATQLEKMMPEYSYMIIDDILWSSDMFKAWKELRNSGKWNASVTFHNYGILIKNPEILESIHINYVPLWSKPWQMRFSV